MRESMRILDYLRNHAFEGYRALNKAVSLAPEDGETPIFERNCWSGSAFLRP